MLSFTLLSAFLASCSIEALAQVYTWKPVHTGASGGWVGNVVFNAAQKDLAYLRTDIGSAYKWNPTTKMWSPLLDWAGPLPKAI